MHLHTSLVNAFKNTINLLFPHIDIVLRTHNQLKAHACQLLHVPYGKAQRCLQKAMGLVVFALRQKLRAAHNADNLRLFTHDFHTVLAIAQLEVLQHIGQNIRITARRHKGCVAIQLVRRHSSENAPIRTKACCLAQLLGSGAINFALFRQAFQRSIEQHQGVDASLLEFREHLLLA